MKKGKVQPRALAKIAACSVIAWALWVPATQAAPANFNTDVDNRNKDFQEIKDEIMASRYTGPDSVANHPSSSAKEENIPKNTVLLKIKAVEAERQARELAVGTLEGADERLKAEDVRLARLIAGADAAARNAQRTADSALISATNPPTPRIDNMVNDYCRARFNNFPHGSVIPKRIRGERAMQTEAYELTFECW